MKLVGSFIIGIIIGYLIAKIDFKIHRKSNRHLIYYCVSGDQTYLDLFKYALGSLKKFLNRPNDDVDILIITSESFEKKVREIAGPGSLIIKSLPDTQINPYTLRLELFDIFPEVQSYNKVLYLDTDTMIVNNNINNLFDEYLNPSLLHVFKEPGVTEYNSMFTIAPVSKDYQNYLFSRNLYPFNSGTFMFCPNVTMKAHFNGVNKLRKISPISHYDQDYLNYYFNILKLSSDNSVLERYVLLIDCVESTVRSSDIHPILHFYNHTGYAKFKLKSMTETFNKN
jgi:lipopolysaccharide biosynthesis glycosyltransferase